jgi:manganese/zinc/iron transport system permease protein
MSYGEQPFWEFLALWGQRLFQFLPLDQWALDEIQLAVLVLLGCCGAMVGSWLVVRRLAMVANALSHTILIGLVVAFLVGGGLWGLLLGALVAGLLTGGMTDWFSRALRLSEDSAIGLTYSALFSIGVIALTLLTKNSHLGTEAVMGQIDALDADDLRQVAWITGFNCLLGLLFYRGYLISAFDGALARTLGFSSSWLGRLLMAQVALTSIGAFRAVGVVLVVALLVLPPLTARLYVHRLGAVMGLAAGISALASLLAVALSRHCLTAYQLPLSTSGLLVLILGLFYFISLAAIKVRIRYRVSHVAHCVTR